MRESYLDLLRSSYLLNSFVIPSDICRRSLFFVDEKKDHRSLERKLPRSLFLVVKRNRAEDPWQFPQGKLKEGETLRMVRRYKHSHLYIVCSSILVYIIVWNIRIVTGC